MLTMEIFGMTNLIIVKQRSYITNLATVKIVVLHAAESYCLINKVSIYSVRFLQHYSTLFPIPIGKENVVLVYS